MSIRNLDPMFEPASVAVIGASARPGSLGATVWRQLCTGGFKGTLHAVNPRHREIDGHKVHANVAALPGPPDLAVICTAAARVPGLIEELGALGTRAALVLSGGLDAAQRAAMLAAARPHLLRILGPDSAGLLVPHLGLNANLAPVSARPGTLALVSQSGSLASAMLDWAAARAIGFSHVVSLGDQSDVDVGDMLDYLASDARTRAILLYIENVPAARKFMSAARAAARNKPVIVVRSGRGQACDAVYDAAIARAGMLRVDELQHLLLAAETLTRLGGLRAERLSVISNGSGAARLAVDAALRAGIELVALSELAEATQALLARQSERGQAGVVDLGGLADAAAQRRLLEALLADPAAGALLFIHAPSAALPAEGLARELLPLLQRPAQRLLSCWLGEAAVAGARQQFRDAGIADYPTPEDAVRAFAMLVSYRRNQAQLLEAPAAARPDPGAPDPRALRRQLQDALAKGHGSLEPEALRALLAAYGIALTAPTAGLVPDRPDCRPRDAHALYISARIDPVFGPVIEFGCEGANVLGAQRDSAVALPPLNTSLARALVQRTRAARRLAGYADMPAADQNALHDLLVAVSQMLADLPEIESLDIAPLLLDPRGAHALDARVRLSAAAPAGAAHFAIRPYPVQWVQALEWQGQALTLRPIRPEDEAQHMVFLSRLDPEDIRLRVFYSRRSIERSELARLTQIDYDREFAFVAVAAGEDGVEQTLGTVRAVADPDNIEAEFGIIVRSDLKGQGLGELLMRKLIATLSAHGTQRLVATVLNENQRMLELARSLGFQEQRSAPGEGVHHFILALQTGTPVA